MNLAIDLGNNRTKLAIFEDDEIIHSSVLKDKVAESLFEIGQKFTGIRRCIIASVTKDIGEVTLTLNKLGINYTILNSSQKLPIKNHYRTKDTLGMDRLAAIAGAHALFPERNILIIDAGTAVTYDLITKKEGYQGGNISPGLEMRYRALHHFTDKLPLINKQDQHSLIGQSSRDAIVNGVQNGLIFEIEGYLTRFGNKYPQLIVILTGGDAQFFDNKLKKAIFVVPNLILIGLNFILNYNAQAK
jgi:type III pantothenate kinase